MNDVGLCCLVLLFTVVAIYFWSGKTRKNKGGKSLPGPPFFKGLRILIKGMMSNTLHHYLPEWAEEYGDIMQINLVIKKVVIINSADVFKRLIKDADFRDFTNDRPPTFFGKYINEGDKDIVLAQFGPVLQQKRKIFHNILKFYGEGKGHFEELMTMSLTDLVAAMKKQETVDFSVSIRNYILSLVGFLLTGDISEAAKKNLGTLKKFSDSADSIGAFEIESILHAFPFLRFIPGLRYKKLYESICTTKNALYDTYIYAMKNTLDPSRKRGMIDEFFLIKQDQSIDFQFDEATIKAVLHNVVGGAYLTSSAALNSLFLHLITTPDIQHRIYEEITKVIGDSTPSFKHRQDMPYTEAVILETLRYSSILPLLVPHFTREDIVFDGYFIPKATPFIMNAWHNHHRQDFWIDPSAFRPERFMDANRHLLDPDHPTRQRMIPFGTGRRQCPGETFAKSRVFLVTTFLLQHFEFLPCEKEPLPSLDPRDWEPKMVLSPDSYKCRIRIRDRFTGKMH